MRTLSILLGACAIFSGATAHCIEGQTYCWSNRTLHNLHLRFTRSREEREPPHSAAGLANTVNTEILVPENDRDYAWDQLSRADKIASARRNVDLDTAFDGIDQDKALFRCKRVKTISANASLRVLRTVFVRECNEECVILRYPTMKATCDPEA